MVDQDIPPDWFEQEEYKKVFRKAVADWWKALVLVDQKLDELNQGYYMLKCCVVKKLCNDVKVILNDSQVGEMWGASTAIDFKNYPNVKICVSEEGKFTMEVHKSCADKSERKECEC